ncbi:hypothetical protein GOV08_01000 [Candidatus Woesearchaeota archaeon]|nr:hypothetical protein [Candidatus Woesearchaeota archaeon]
MKSKILFSIILIAAVVFLVSCTPSQAPITEKDADVGITEEIQEVVVVEQTTQEAATDEGFDTSKEKTYETGCYDSEGGIFYEKRGYIIDAKGERFEDECLTEFTLNDVRCGLVGYKDENVITCDYKCLNGECIEGEEEAPKTCVDSDFKDYSTKGTVTYQGKTTTDYCGEKPNMLMEQLCSAVGIPTKEEKYCSNGCADGACIEITVIEEKDCIDSDIGPDKEFIKGYVTDKKSTVYDECINANTVKEYRCNTIGYRDSNNYDCENGCEDGACIR